MDIEIVQSGAHIALIGRLSAATVGDVRIALQRAVDAGTGDLIVDLSQAELVDATGLGVLVGTHRRAHRAGRRLVLHGVSERMQRLLLVTRLNRVLSVEQPLPVG